MSIGAVLDESWTIYTRFFMRLFVLAAVVFLGVNVVVAALATTDGGLPALLGVVAMLGASYWLQGALVQAVVDARDGRFDASIGDTFRSTLPHLAALIGAGLLAGLGVALGLIALVVPGLWLLTIWALIAPVIVLEGRGVLASLTRSRQLVRGRGWTVFALIAVSSAISWVAGTILAAAFGFLGAFGEVLIGNTIAYAVVAPFIAVVVTVTYLRLREEKEGAAQISHPTDRGIARAASSATDAEPGDRDTPAS